MKGLQRWLGKKDGLLFLPTNTLSCMSGIWSGESMDTMESLDTGFCLLTGNIRCTSREGMRRRQ